LFGGNKNMLLNKKIIHFAIILFLFFLACQTFPDKTQIKNGKRYCTTKEPFKGRWWQFYDRGQSCTKGQFFKEAGNDFREAIKRFRFDKKDARTYGMRYVDRGYFPHRELGIVLIYQQQYKEAITELETSIGYEPTTRAKKYLDIARKEWIKKNDLDKKQPVIQIFSPKFLSWTNRTEIHIHGKICDDTYVKKVQLNHHELYIDVSKKEISFWQKIPTVSGKNIVSIVASDISGNISEKKWVVYGDMIGPVVSIDDNSLNKPDPFLYACDNSGISEIFINNKLLKFDGQQSVKLYLPDLSATVIVKDIAGNITSSKGLLKNQAHLVVSAADNLYFSSQMRLNQIQISKPLHMNDDKMIHDVYLDALKIEGNIRGDTVNNIFCNQKTIPVHGKSNNYFSLIRKLKSGHNGIIIRAYNDHHLLSEKQIMVNKKQVDVKSLDFRLKIALRNENNHPFINKLMTLFKRIILSRFRFGFVPNQNQSDAILSFSLDKEKGLYLGIAATIEDKECDLPLATVDYYEPISQDPISVQQLNHMLTMLHIHLENEIPLYEGKVIRVLDEETIKTNLGILAGMTVNTKIIIFNKQRNLVSGKARINHLDNFSSNAKVWQVENLKEGDYVITQ